MAFVRVEEVDGDFVPIGNFVPAGLKPSKKSKANDVLTRKPIVSKPKKKKQYSSSGETSLQSAYRNLATPAAGMVSGALGALPGFASQMAGLSRYISPYLETGADDPIAGIYNYFNPKSKMKGSVGDSLIDLIERKGADWGPKGVQSSLEGLTGGYLKPTNKITESITSLGRDMGQFLATGVSPSAAAGAIAGQRGIKALGGGKLAQAVGSGIGGFAAGGLRGLVGGGVKRAGKRVAAASDRAIEKTAATLESTEAKAWDVLGVAAKRSKASKEFVSVLDETVNQMKDKIKIPSSRKPLKSFIDSIGKELVNEKITPAKLVDLRKSINGELLNGIYKEGTRIGTGAARSVIKDFKTKVDGILASQLGKLQFNAAEATRLRKEFIKGDVYKNFLNKAEAIVGKEKSSLAAKALVGLIPAGSSVAGFLYQGLSGALGATAVGAGTAAVGKTLGIATKNFKILLSSPEMRAEAMKAIRALGKRSAFAGALSPFVGDKSGLKKAKQDTPAEFKRYRGKVIT